MRKKDEEKREEETLTIVCSHCGREIVAPLSWMRAYPEVTCSCDTVIDLRKDDFLGQIRKAEQEAGRGRKKFS